MSRRGWLFLFGLSVLVLTALWSSSLITGAPSAQINATQTEAPNQGIGALLSGLATATPTPNDQTATAVMMATQYAPNTEIASTLRAQMGGLPGRFAAYFLAVPGSSSAVLGTIRQALMTRFGWTTQNILPESLLDADSLFYLNNPNADGEVIVIVGGSSALSDDELQALKDYVAKGGSMVIFAGTNLIGDHTSLATSDNLNDWLYSSFGMRFNKDVVLDQTQAFTAALYPVATDLNSSHFITTNGITAGQAALVFEEPDSITIAANPPANVTVTALARSTASAYSTTDLAHLNNSEDRENGDTSGPFVLAAAAENTQTHARIVLLGSVSIGSDTYKPYNNIGNLSVAFNSLVWAADYNDYYNQHVVPQYNAIATAVQQTLTAPITPTPTIQPGISTFS